MKDFIIGVNYWASNAGTAMWTDWSEDTVDKDIEVLSENNIKMLRVFPLWSAFQPVKPMYTGGGFFKEYRMEDESFPANPYYLDEIMLDRFEKFLDVCKKYDVKVIVGLITGWMSGRLFIPSALYDKDLYSDAKALMFEQKFVKGFVKRFKDRAEIYAWNLGNECNCMQPVKDRETAYSWIAMISNAIKAEDNTRLVISGMSGLDIGDGPWTIEDNAEIVDILTTHPYPLWVPYGSKDCMNSMRTLLLPSYMCSLNSDISGKPCLVEEIGTMGPMVCDEEETAVGFARVNLISCLATGSKGFMWWCAHDQNKLKTAPYSWIKCEVELGMTKADREEKPVLKEFDRFYNQLKETELKLVEAKKDAVVILTEGQDRHGVGYMTYVLSKQAKANVKFAYCNDCIPKSDIYMFPSVSGNTVIKDENYRLILERVYNGATLYISNDDGMFSEFESFSGLRVIDSNEMNVSGTINIGHEKIPYTQKKRYILKSVGAEILAESDGNIMFSKYSYGKGQVYYLNFPIEKNLIDKSYGFDGNCHLIYKEIFRNCKKAVNCENKYIGITEHLEEDGTCIAVLINYSNKEQTIDLQMQENKKMAEIIIGNINTIEPYGYTVIRIK